MTYYTRDVIFIGYEERQDLAAQVCKYSIERLYPTADVFLLDHKTLRKEKLFWRKWLIDSETGNYRDGVDGKPFSNQFSHTRFLVPTYAQFLGYNGFAMFVDPDFVFLENVEELFEECATEFDTKDTLVNVVKFDDYGVNESGVKMDNQSQVGYPRKLWSSLMVFDLSAYDWYNSDYIEYVNKADGLELHQLKYYPDEKIGSILPQWNYVPGFTSKIIKPHAIHYTEGLPTMKGYEDCELSVVFKEMAREYQQLQIL